jgi:flagellar basal-body rod modification protein FlgD
MSDLSTTVGSVGTVAATAGTDATKKAAAGQQQLTADKTQFLTLLTAQLKNQDPLSPMDSTQFTNQLVQYSAVEQQININSNLATLITLTQQSVLSGASNYVGKAIQATSDTAPLQNGSLNASYTLSANSQSTTIVIRDATGNVVHSQQGQTKAGTYTLSWDGKTAGGEQMPDGAYTVTITALGQANKPVDTTTTVYGTVTSVTTDPTTNETLLRMGPVAVPLSKVVAVG